MPTNADRLALTCVVTESALTQVVTKVIGAGMRVPRLETKVLIPLLGKADVAAEVFVTGGRVALHAIHQGKLEVTISADTTLAVTPETGTAMAPQQVAVEVRVLVAMIIERTDAGALRVGVDLDEAELVELALIATDGSAIGGGQMGQMLAQAVGGDAFEAVRSNMFQTVREVAGPVVELFDVLEVATGPARIMGRDGRVEIGFVGVDEGQSAPFGSPTGPTMAVGLTSDALASFVTAQLAGMLDDLPVPYEIDMTSESDRLVTQIRNARLLPGLLPDLRPSLKVEVEPRLAAEALELCVRSAWLEAPLIPGFVNRISRFVGGAIAVVPLRLKYPATAVLPVPPSGDQVLDIEVAGVEVIEEGLIATLAIT